MAFHRVLIAVLTMCAFMAHGGTQAAYAQSPSTPTQEIVNLNSADGLQAVGVMTWPPGPTVPAGPVILHLPDGPGDGPLRAADTARYMAQGLARAGYPSLSLETRHTLRYPFGEFDDAFADVKAAIDMLFARGFSSVVLAGDGLGSLLAVRYAARGTDSRVKAVIAYAPSPDLPASLRTKIGDTKYQAMVKQASEAVDEDVRGIFVDAGQGLIFMPPAFLDWYGPDAKTSLTASIGPLDKPILLAAGSTDATVPTGRLQQLASLAGGGKKATIKTYDGVGHDFGNARAKLVADTVNWLGDISIPPAVQVVTTIVDTKAKDGTPLSGIIYAPSRHTVASARPAFMIVHGWTGDIMRSTSHWLSVRLAQRGYTVLAVRTRSSGFRGTVRTRLEDIPQDIAAWSDFMAARGHQSLVGIGHTTGSLWLSTYLAQTKDPRVKGVVYLGPSRDLPAYAKHAMGAQAYDQVVREAQAAVKKGEGATHLIDVPFPQATYDEDPRQPMYLSLPVTGFTYYYANAFLSYWGPDSRAVHTKRITEFPQPILAVGGSRDPHMQGAWLLHFSKLAGKRATPIFYGGPTGAPASFEGYEAKLTDDIVGWTAKLQ